jgi:hypothetical protein
VNLEKAQLSINVILIACVFAVFATTIQAVILSRAAEISAECAIGCPRTGRFSNLSFDLTACLYSRGRLIETRTPLESSEFIKVCEIDYVSDTQVIERSFLVTY